MDEVFENYTIQIRWLDDFRKWEDIPPSYYNYPFQKAAFYHWVKLQKIWYKKDLAQIRYTVGSPNANGNYIDGPALNKHLKRGRRNHQ